MPPDYWKIVKNSTLYVVIWRYSVPFFLSFFFLLFLSFFFLGGDGPSPPQMTPLVRPKFSMTLHSSGVNSAMVLCGYNLHCRSWFSFVRSYPNCCVTSLHVGPVGRILYSVHCEGALVNFVRGAAQPKIEFMTLFCEGDFNTRRHLPCYGYSTVSHL